MEHENQLGVTGQELGCEGVERLVDEFDNICAQERRRIELANEALIIALRMELVAWADEEERIGERLRLAPPPGDRRSRRVQAWIAGGVAFALTVAGFFFSLLAFDPFRLGWKSYLYCLGIAIVSPFCVDKCLKEWDCRGLIKALATVACVAAVASLVLLAVVRGDLVGQELKDAERVVVVTDSNTTAPQEEGDQFYKEALPLLELVMALLAVAMELGAGLALHDARKLASDSGEDAEQIARQLMGVRSQMAALASRIVDYANEGAGFEARFRRDFCRAMLTHAKRKTLGKILVFALSLALLGSASARADGQRLNFVVLIDLSASVASKGPDGKTDFEKNVAAVGDLLAQVPAGSRVTILGITANSFAEPDILLTAEVPLDAGYFGERLAAAHRQLLRAWQARTAQLSPSAKQTDILGALLVADQFFQATEREARKVLVIYSDMRQATAAFNLERPGALTTGVPFTKARTTGPTPDLKGVEVYGLGVDAAGRNVADWNALQQFWSRYFEAAGAHLDSYSVLRDSPRL